MPTYRYRTHGTCSTEIHITTDGQTVNQVEFVGGCSGNTQAVATLVRGMRLDEVIAKLEGIDCGGKGTSCPDQLARALSEIQAHVAR